MHTPHPPPSCSAGTCSSFMATSLKPRRSKRPMTSPTNRRCTASGFTNTNVCSRSSGGAGGARGHRPCTAPSPSLSLSPNPEPIPCDVPHALSVGSGGVCAPKL